MADARTASAGAPRAAASPSRGAASPWVRRLIIGASAGWLILMLLLPVVSVFAAAFADGWGVFVESLLRPDALHAAWLTVLAVLAAVSFNAVFGIAAAWAVTRTRLPGRRAIRVVLDLPIAVSPVVAGLMFLLLFGRQGWFGPLADSLGIKVVFALPGILLATIFVTIPFVAKEVIGVLEENGPAEEEAAATLGARGWQVFANVVFPNIRWAVFYGLVLTTARALGEFGAVSVLSGNLIGKTQTLPLYIEHAYISYETTAAFAAAVPLTLLAVLTIAAHKVVGYFASRDRGRAPAKETS